MMTVTMLLLGLFLFVDVLPDLELQCFSLGLHTVKKNRVSTFLEEYGFGQIDQDQQTKQEVCSKPYFKMFGLGDTKQSRQQAL